MLSSGQNGFVKRAGVRVKLMIRGARGTSKPGGRAGGILEGARVQANGVGDDLGPGEEVFARDLFDEARLFKLEVARVNLALSTEKLLREPRGRGQRVALRETLIADQRLDLTAHLQ